MVATEKPHVIPTSAEEVSKILDTSSAIIVPPPRPFVKASPFDDTYRMTIEPAPPEGTLPEGALPEGTPPGAVTLSSPAQFKALGHPARHRLVNVLRQRPATLRQLAEALGLAKGTISYHLRVLREANLVELSRTQHVRGGTQEYFGLVSGDLRHEEGAVGPDFLVRAALDEMRLPHPGRPEQTVLRHLWLTPAEAAALAARLTDQAAGLAGHATQPGTAVGSGREPYGLLLSLYPADIPALPADEPG
jgi:DNA-binding transcriptional ArsR family regulator